MEGKEKVSQLHRSQPFYSHPQRQAILKHQSAFWSHENEFRESAEFNFFTQEDPYEATKFEVLKHKWFSDSKMLYGDFKPSGSNKSLSNYTR
jgi:hypothetical protein